MRNWSRSQYFDETGLKWINPSPNLRSAAANVPYPGVELLQPTNVSVGRGTDTPFEHIGAPYLDAAQLAAYLTERKIPGISFAPSSFTVGGRFQPLSLSRQDDSGDRLYGDRPQRVRCT